jgi:hypothetical protein
LTTSRRFSAKPASRSPDAGCARHARSGCPPAIWLPPGFPAAAPPDRTGAHFAQVGLFDIIEILLAGLLQPLAHFFIGQDLMLQHAELRQRFAAGGAAAGGIMANISQPAMAERCEKRDRR